MKFDMFYLIQLIFLFSVVTYTYMCFRYYIYGNRAKLNSITVNFLTKVRLDFSSKFTVNKYKAYEKIDIWRYCSLF